MVFAKGLLDDQLQKRGWGNNILTALKGKPLKNPTVGSGANLAGDASSTTSTNPGLLTSLSGQRINHQQFFSELDSLLSSKNYAQAKHFLKNFDNTDEVYNELLQLAVKKGDDNFLLVAINSNPRSVMGDLHLMKYARETTDHARANFLSSTIANNMGDTVVVGNTGKNRYYDLNSGRYAQPSDKAEQIVNKFLSLARTEPDKKVWHDIMSDIQTYGRRRTPPPQYFPSLERYLTGNNEVTAAKLFLNHFDQFPIGDYFKTLTYVIKNGDPELIRFAFSKGTIRRFPSADAEFMKLARELHPGPKGDELSSLIGKGIPAENAEDTLQYALQKSREAKNIQDKTAWEGTVNDLYTIDGWNDF